jgi:hypothetical protein
VAAAVSSRWKSGRSSLAGKVAAAARDLVARQRDAVQDINNMGKVESAVKALVNRLANWGRSGIFRSDGRVGRRGPAVASNPHN